jgi:hypothetical protein
MLMHLEEVMTMVRSLVLALLFACLSVMSQFSPARADDGAAFQRIISDQIAAFNSDNGTKAFSFATPELQRMFMTPDNFMSMVKKGYQPVYRQKSFRFAETFTDPAGRPAQKVVIVDQAGKVWTAIYTFEKQLDGTWRISSCALVEPDGADA